MASNKKQTIGFVLLHGAGLGAWVWKELAAELSYPFLAVDYPGRGKHAGAAVSGLPLSAYVETALSDIDGFESGRVIVVAHSIGGLIGLEVARLRRERVSGFVAVSAAIPARRGSYASSLTFPAGIFLRLMLAFAGTRPPAAAIKAGLCNDLDEKRSAEVVNRFFPESKKLYTNRMSEPGLPEKSLYIRLKNDRAISPALQNRMISNLKAQKVAEIDSGHLPMLGRPRELARILNDYALSLIG